MVASNVKFPVFCALTMLTALATGAAHAAAHAKTAQQPIVVDAQSVDADLNNNTVVFRKVRISQGNMAVTADSGQGTQQKTRLDFSNDTWTFRGNVKISMADGQLNSDDAQINFVNQTLSKAVANGKPATFEQRVEKTGKLAQGHADQIDYDSSSGLVRLIRNAWLTNGQTEIRGELLKYNIKAQSIVAEAADQQSQRVHIVITPPPQKP